MTDPVTFTVCWRPCVYFLICSVCPSSLQPRLPVCASVVCEEQLAQQGLRSLASGCLDQAEAAFAELASLQPNVAEVHANLGAVYFQEGRFDAAIDALRQALRFKPSLTKGQDPVSHLPGRIRSLRRSPPRPRSRLSLLSRAPKFSAIAASNSLRAYTALHRDAEAVETSLALNKAYPDDGEILYQTGKIYGNFTYLTMEKLRDKAPNSVWMLQAKAEAQESEKQYDLALTSIEGVLRLEPRRPGVRYRMGRVYLARFEQLHESKDRDQAADQFRAELAIDPMNGNAAYELAQID